MAATEHQQAESAIVWETPDTPITTHDFILDNGRRFVRPYFFEFIAHVKERWNGKKIARLFAEEFRQRPLQYYIQAVDAGRILVNGKMVTNEYVVRSSQTLSHFVHRHEPPVMGESVEILELGADVITVCKPPSVPVHPCGQYRKNTVLGILQAEHNLGPLYPIHRLDRLVSGLLILARNSHTADQFRQEIEGGTIKKSYIAKVQGVFPEEEVELNAAVVYDPKEGRSTVKESVDELERKTLKRSPEGQRGENPAQFWKGKGACTRFRRIHSDGVHSIVECMPLTGRTHQIRVHLQYLGHPIANDVLYTTQNPPKRTEMGTNAERAARMEVIPNHDTSTCQNLTPDTTSVTSSPKRRRICEDRIGSSQDIASQLAMRGDRPPLNDKLEDKEGAGLTSPENTHTAGHGVEFVVDPMCTHCPNLFPLGYEGEEHGLWLHCKSYSSHGWKYECPLPSWATIPL